MEKVVVYDFIIIISSSSSIISFWQAKVRPTQGPYRPMKKKVPFTMAIGNVELMQECFHKH